MTKPAATEFVVEHGVPLPPPGERQGGVAATFRKMRVGDSVVMPSKKRSCIFSVAKATGIRATVRRIDDKSFRVWRIL